MESTSGNAYTDIGLVSLWYEFLRDFFAKPFRKTHTAMVSLWYGFL